MKSSKCNTCGSKIAPLDDQSPSQCVRCGSRQPYDASAQQELTAVRDCDIVDEIDYLLSLYKIALDGNVWSKPDPIFDHVLDIEYELPPVPELPFIPEDEVSADFSDEQTESTNVECADNSDKSTFLAKAAAFVLRNKRLSVIAGSVACAAIIILVILGVFLNPGGKYKDVNSQSAMNNPGVSTDSTESGSNFLTNRDNDYKNAVALMDAGNYTEAIIAFQKLDGYKDSVEKISECHYLLGISLLEGGFTLQALNNFSKAGDYKDAPVQAAALRKLYQTKLQAQTLSAGRNHTAVLKADGTVVMTGSNEYYQQDLGPQWIDIVSVCVGETHTVGLKSNGSVVHAGAINRGQRAVTEWWDIVAISAERSHTVGLKADGTVVAAGGNDYGQCDVWYWSDIVAISTGITHTAGLKSDGTAVATGKNLHNQCDVSSWTDIIAICAGDSHTVGIKADGTVVATGYNAYGQCDLSGWENIVDVGIGTAFTVGLKADGTVVTAGYPYGDLDQLSAWTDIVAISVSASHIAGLKADGTVVTVNYDQADQAAMSEWTDIKLPG